MELSLPYTPVLRTINSPMLKFFFNVAMCFSLITGYSVQAFEPVHVHETVDSASHDIHTLHAEASNADEHEECHAKCGHCHCHCHSHQVALSQSIAPSLPPTQAQIPASVHAHIAGGFSSPPYKPNW